MTEINGLTWLAHYSDGSNLAQTGGFAYGDIDRDKLEIFDLWLNNRLLLRVDLRDDSQDGFGRRRLIWRARHFISSDGQKQTVHLCGWQRKVGNRNVQAICYVTGDGTVLLGGQFNSGLPFDDKPELFEKDFK